MNSLFIVTSAIYTSYGKCTLSERIEQTNNTLESIKKYSSKSTIVLIDCGEKSIDQKMFDCEIIDYTKDEEIKFYLQEYLKHNNDIEPDIVIKSMLEIMMFLKYLKSIGNKKYNRIFKLSGRYKLNSKFNVKEHLNSTNKVLILPPYLSQNIYNFCSSPSLLQYMTRCWSFDFNLLPVIIETYEKMKTEIIHISKTEKQGDIEHLLYKHLNKKCVKHIDTMGIEGVWAPFNEVIIE